MSLLSSLRASAAAAALRLRRSPWSPELFLLGLSLFWVLVANRAFFAALGADLSQASGWLFVLAMAVFLIATHGLLLALTG